MARARSLLARRTGFIGVVVTGYKIWKRLPRRHRRRIVKATVKHGPRVAAAIAAKRRKARVMRRS